MDVYYGGCDYFLCSYLSVIGQAEAKPKAQSDDNNQSNDRNGYTEWSIFYIKFFEKRVQEYVALDSNSTGHDGDSWKLQLSWKYRTNSK